jgi:hypothetical protein
MSPSAYFNEGAKATVFGSLASAWTPLAVSMDSRVVEPVTLTPSELKVPDYCKLHHQRLVTKDLKRRRGVSYPLLRRSRRLGAAGPAALCASAPDVSGAGREDLLDNRRPECIGGMGWAPKHDEDPQRLSRPHLVHRFTPADFLALARLLLALLQELCRLPKRLRRSLQRLIRPAQNMSFSPVDGLTNGRKEIEGNELFGLDRSTLS